jgi:hypothetical protein
MAKSSKQQADCGAPEKSLQLPPDFFVPTLTAVHDDPAEENEEFQFGDQDPEDVDD